MKLVTIVGTRPEIIRTSRILPKLDALCEHTIVHTNQNFTKNLKDIFFNELGLRQPDIVLHSSMNDGNTHTSFGLGQQLADMFPQIEKVFNDVKPDKVFILGDTNSALCSIIAERMGIPVFHMESSNRSFNREIPEEVNRRLIDSISSYNLFYTNTNRHTLLKEGADPKKIFQCGNPTLEVLTHYKEKINQSRILHDLGLMPHDWPGIVDPALPYFLVDIHRSENVNNPDRLKSIFEGVNMIAEEFGNSHFSNRVICSIHPKTKDMLTKIDYIKHDKVVFLDAFGFFDFVKLEQNARVGLSDCLHPDTLIMQSNGTIKSIKELKSNESIISDAGDELVILTGTTNSTKKYKIITKYNEIKGSENHCLFVRGKEGTSVEKKIKDITKKDYLLSFCEVHPSQFIDDVPLIPVKQKDYIKINDEGTDIIRKKSKGQTLKEFGRFKCNVLFLRKGMPLETIKLLLSHLEINYEDFKKYIYTDKEQHQREISIRQPNILNENIATVIGFLCGDGSINSYHSSKCGSHSRVMFCDQNEETLNFLAKLMDKEFLIKGQIQKSKQTNGVGRTLVYGSKTLVEFLRLNFPSECETTFTNKKDISNSIINSKDHIVSKYLKGIYEAEGFVNDHGIGITMVDEKVITKIKYLLLRFGIIANYYKTKGKREKDKRHLHTLYIYEHGSRYLYREKIGFISAYKKGRLDEMLSKVDSNKRKKPIKRDNGLFYDLIRSIEVIEDDEKYIDIHVKPSNVFLANGILSHNSGLCSEEYCLMHVPCVIVRNETERPEVVEAGGAIISGTTSTGILESVKIIDALKDRDWSIPDGYNDLNVSDKVVNYILSKNQ